MRRLLLVYNADSGLMATLLDVLKKLTGREDCSLCELTHGPLGKRASWAACQVRLGIAVEELHRDQLPPEWGIDQLPCILLRSGDAPPQVLVTRAEIASCVSVEQLERLLQRALS